MVDLLKQMEVLKDASDTQALFDTSKLAAGSAQALAVQAYLSARGKASAEHIKNMRALYLFNILNSIGQMSYCSVSFGSAAPQMRLYVPATVAAPVVGKAFGVLSGCCGAGATTAKLAPMVELQELV